MFNNGGSYIIRNISNNINKLSNEPIVAIVLDRGVLGTDLDLLMPSENDASMYVGRNTLSYDVLRVGY